MKKFIFTGSVIAVLVAVFLSGAFSSVAMSALAQVTDVRNPIARTVLQKFFPNPNMLIEDHAEISCEPEFSVKVFTATALTNATFIIKNAANGAVIFGPMVVNQINPLWQTVALGPMSSIPPKIQVVMTASTPQGQIVTDTLILEPDCKKPIKSLVNKITIIWPKGKLLFNPPPPLNPPRTPIPLTMVVPKDMVGKNMVIATIWQDPATGVKRYTEAKTLPIDTEILSMSLTSVNPMVVQYPDSRFRPAFFDVFVTVGVGEPQGQGLLTALRGGTDNMPPVQVGDGIKHPDGTTSAYTIDSFFDIFYTIEPVRMIDATPLESLRPVPGDSVIAPPATSVVE